MTFIILFISIMTDPFIIFISYMRTWKSKKVHYLSQLPLQPCFPRLLLEELNLHTSSAPCTFFFKLELFLQYLSILSLPKRKLCKLRMRMVNDTKHAFPMVQSVHVYI